VIAITKPKRFFMGAFVGAPIEIHTQKKPITNSTLIVNMIPSPAPLFKEPAHKVGFCFSATGLSIELHSIIRRKVVFICNDIGWKLAY
jgi:hypothetical protein